jgi:hypothetical protein
VKEWENNEGREGIEQRLKIKNKLLRIYLHGLSSSVIKLESTYAAVKIEKV